MGITHSIRQALGISSALPFREERVIIHFLTQERTDHQTGIKWHLVVGD